MRKIRLDLFKLYDKSERKKGAIKVILTSKLKKIIKEIIEEVKAREKVRKRELIEKFGISYSAFRISFLRNRLPLSFVKKLADYSLSYKEKILDEIKELSSGSGNNYVKVKAPKFLSETLCKIVGAIIADGNLYVGKGRRKWQIKIGDQYEDNLRLFSKWLKEEFNITPKIKKDKRLRMFYIDFSNKVVFYYLNRILGIKVGKKSSEAGMPPIIKKSPFNFQVAFAVGLCMFDGSIGFTRRNFCFSTKSKKLVKDFNMILRKLNINYSYTSKPNPSNNLYQTFIWSENELRKVLRYLLEPHTSKWMQLNILLNGLKNVNSKILNSIGTLYPLPRKTSIGFLDVIKVFRKDVSLSKKEVQLKINRSERTTRALLNSLERMKVLKAKRNKFYKLWTLNPKLLKEVRKVA